MNTSVDSKRRASKDINIMDTDGGDDEDNSSDGDNVCMGSPIVDVEDDSDPPDISAIHMENQNSYQNDISDLLIVGDNRPIVEDATLNLNVLDELSLSSDQPKECLSMEYKQQPVTLISSSANRISRPTSLYNCQTIDSDIDLLKPVVFSSSQCYSNKLLTKPRLIPTNDSKSSSQNSWGSNSPAISNPMRESTAVTSVLPNAMMTTILFGSRNNANNNDNLNSCSGTVVNKSSNVISLQDKSFMKITSNEIRSPQITTNVINLGSSTDTAKSLSNKKIQGKNISYSILMYSVNITNITHFCEFSNS